MLCFYSSLFYSCVFFLDSIFTYECMRLSNAALFLPVAVGFYTFFYYVYHRLHLWRLRRTDRAILSSRAFRQTPHRGARNDVVIFIPRHEIPIHNQRSNIRHHHEQQQQQQQQLQQQSAIHLVANVNNNNNNDNNNNTVIGDAPPSYEDVVKLSLNSQ